MDWFTRRKPYSDAAKSAFGSRVIGSTAASELASFVDDNYQTTSKHFISDGLSIYIPYRLHFLPKVQDEFSNLSQASHCLLTRSTDGYLRQKSSKSIIRRNTSWTIPFVVLLLGEYVIEIVEDIHASVGHLDRAAYADFVRQNRTAMREIRARATSYWNIYHRQIYPDRKLYPAIAVLNQLDGWAS
ncbi:hypothetical protein [Mesorhizobium sp. SP-1A]|uniref:hypothetical protein n=1 Tax=Mesorhizobium sp. SP-1A TaxID=3077840 RepID=UPI0028F7371D|nr:hypothetical protein [Mesorhizobium sp. SP-1A]